MKKFFAITLIYLLFINSAYALSNKTLARVDDKIITSHDLEAKIDLAEQVVKAPIARDKETLNEYLNLMIDELVMEKIASKHGISVSAGEIETAIQRIADNNNVSAEEFKQSLRSNNLSVDSFKDSLKFQIIRSKLIDQKLRPQISITSGEISKFKKTSIKNDYELSLFQVIANEKQKLDNLTTNHKNKNCEDLSKLAKEENLEYSTYSVHFSELKPEIKSIIEKMKVGELSKILTINEEYNIIKLCSKKQIATQEISDEDAKKTLYEMKLAEAYNRYISDNKPSIYIKIY